MFGSLSDFQQDENLAEQSPYFYIYTEDTAMRYQIIAYYTTTGDSNTYSLVHTDEEYDAWLQWIFRNNQFAGYEEEMTAERPGIVTLSTCYGRAGGTERFVVHGVLSAEKEMEQIGK